MRLALIHAMTLAVTVAYAMSPAPLQAQALAASPARIGIMGGATFPRNQDMSNVFKTGWNAGAVITLGSPAFPLSFRIDGQWHQLGGKTITRPDVGDRTTDLRVIDGTADFQWMFGGKSGSGFYLLGGVGFYNLRGRIVETPGNVIGGDVQTATLSATKFGWNGGAGYQFRLTGYSLFIESRYHAISHGHEVDGSGSSKSMHIIPLDIGITL
jgi:hypothetical protein